MAEILRNPLLSPRPVAATSSAKTSQSRAFATTLSVSPQSVHFRLTDLAAPDPIGACPHTGGAVVAMAEGWNIPDPRAATIRTTVFTR
jgi:hypothetical protein